MACGCDDITTPCVSLCADAVTGCPIQLDFDCIIYHKTGSRVSNLTGTVLPNGTTLTLFAETVDNLVGQTKVASFNLPFLRAGHTITSLKLFAEAVDTELSQLRTDVTTLQAGASTPITPIDSNSIDLTISGLNNHTVKADAKISASANNLISILSDGLFVTPQTLTADYTNKKISISNGNTIDLAGLVCGVGGFLGNLAADPTTIDGQYWFNTTSNLLKIKVNGLVKTITIS